MPRPPATAAAADARRRQRLSLQIAALLSLLLHVFIAGGLATTSLGILPAPAPAVPAAARSIFKPKLASDFPLEVSKSTAEAPAHEKPLDVPLTARPKRPADRKPSPAASARSVSPAKPAESEERPKTAVTSPRRSPAEPDRSLAAARSLERTSLAAQPTTPRPTADTAAITPATPSTPPTARPAPAKAAPSRSSAGAQATAATARSRPKEVALLPAAKPQSVAPALKSAPRQSGKDAAVPPRATAPARQQTTRNAAAVGPSESAATIAAMATPDATPAGPRVEPSRRPQERREEPRAERALRALLQGSAAPDAATDQTIAPRGAASTSLPTISAAARARPRPAAVLSAPAAAARSLTRATTILAADATRPGESVAIAADAADAGGAVAEGTSAEAGDSLVASLPLPGPGTSFATRNRPAGAAATRASRLGDITGDPAADNGNAGDTAETDDESTGTDAADVARVAISTTALLSGGDRAGVAAALENGPAMPGGIAGGGTTPVRVALAADGVAGEESTSVQAELLAGLGADGAAGGSADPASASAAGAAASTTGMTGATGGTASAEVGPRPAPLASRSASSSGAGSPAVVSRRTDGPSGVTAPTGSPAGGEDTEDGLSTDGMTAALPAMSVAPSGSRRGAGVAAAAAPAAAPLPRAAAIVLPVEGRVREIAEPFVKRTKERRTADTEKTDGMVDRGLDFLRRAQQPDGRWSLAAYPGAAGEAAPKLASDTAATGLALLSFLGAGHDHFAGKHRDTVRRGLEFLLAVQKADGDLYAPADQLSNSCAWLYSHGIATMSLCEAVGMTGDDLIRPAAARACGFISTSQHPERGGWRYTPRSDADLSVSGWMLVALRSGQLARVPVEQRTLDGVRSLLDASLIAPPSPAAKNKLARFHYNARKPEQRPSEMSTACMTALGTLMRLHTGWKSTDDRVVENGHALAAMRPTYGSPNEKIRDCYLWYYMSQVLVHTGGEEWDSWYESLGKTLAIHQETAGPRAGSWDPLGPMPDRWGPYGGRLYVTALHLLTLEVPYRHLPTYSFGDAPP